MSGAKDALIRAENLHRVFVTDEVETHALAGIHLSIARGEYVAISGPSGCGKSTLMAILGLLDTPSEGDYWLDGRPVASLTPSERARIRNRRVGFIFQSFNLIGDLTVHQNVELPLLYRRVPSAQRRQWVQEALDRVGCRIRAKHLSGPTVRRAASGGGRPRVVVTTCDPLADEPTGNLDSNSGGR